MKEFFRYGIYSGCGCVGGSDSIKEARIMADERKKFENELFPEAKNDVKVYRLSEYTGERKDLLYIAK